MKARTIILWIFSLIIIDQIIKIVIYSFFFGTQFEIIPSLFEFKPVFNDKHSYLNVLLYKNFNIDLGLCFHIVLFLLAEIIFLAFYYYMRKNITGNKKLLDIAIIFQSAGLICGLIGNLIWKKGTLDYIYLKPLFVFDLKDVYLNCFPVLFLVYLHKVRSQTKTIKIKDIILYIKESIKAE